MKILTREEILALLNREQRSSISDEQLEAIRHEERLRLHSEIQLTMNSKLRWRALRNFLADIPQSILPPEKYEKFENLITYPLPTVEVTDAAYNELYKVFFGQNRVVEFSFDDNHEELEEDWEEYRINNGFIDWIRLEGWDVFKNHINAPIVIDLPPLIIDEDGRMQMKSDKPEPFFFFVPTENVVDQHNDHTNNTHFLLYENETSPEFIDKFRIDKIAYYVDSERYSSWVRKEDVWQFADEATHDLGFAPVKSFWFKPLRDSVYQRQNPVTPNLGALDWLLYSIISKRNLDLYAGFPIVSVYEQQCDYKNSDGFSCEGGFVAKFTTPQRNETATMPCPRCTDTQMIGPGSTIVLPLPNPDAESNINLMPGVEITEGDVASLKQMNDEIRRQRTEFMIHMTGFDQGENDPLQPSKNKEQLLAHFESRHNIIVELKVGFEIIEKFINDTAAKLRYGDKYMGSVFNYGSRFFIKSEAEMQEDYQAARESGMPAFELDNMRVEIYKKKYASDPKILDRVLLLSQLEPYRDYTTLELQQLQLFVSPENMSLKIAFNDLIARFEREHGPIEQHLRGLLLKDRVALIDAELKRYLKEEKIPAQQNPELLISNEITNGRKQNISKPQVRQN